MEGLKRSALIAFEFVILSALILCPRWANHQDVFVGDGIYFTDADCYARMTRARMCAEHPGLIIRHHDFENYPSGTTPHTTAPLDYLIVALSIPLTPFTAQPLDLAGALISPLLALLGGWFLLWWSRSFRHRWIMLVLYAISPMLVHGGELGRPDHQSLTILLVTIAICAEWTLVENNETRAIGVNRPYLRWSSAGGISWAIAVWVSAYEPLILLLLLLLLVIGLRRGTDFLFSEHRRLGWILFAAILAIAFLIERRIPSAAVFSGGTTFKNWARTIGELGHVWPVNPIWLRWTGYLLLVAPLLVWFRFRLRKTDAAGHRALLMIVGFVVATFGLTVFQARWGYFFVLLFALGLPILLETIKSGTTVWIAFVLSLYPILKDWDERLWPNDAELARRTEQRHESAQIREMAISLRSTGEQAFLAPWWLSPSIAYWSGQPGVAGSSHESLGGIEVSARFFLSSDWGEAREILEKRRVQWVLAYDSGRVVQNSAALLGRSPTGHELCFVLDRTPAQAPRFLDLLAQNGVAKLYRVANNL